MTTLHEQIKSFYKQQALTAQRVTIEYCESGDREDRAGGHLYALGLGQVGEGRAAQHQLVQDAAQGPHVTAHAHLEWGGVFSSLKAESFYFRKFSKTKVRKICI